MLSHRRDEIVQAIKEAAQADRPDEIRDWDSSAKRSAGRRVQRTGTVFALHEASQPAR